VDLASREKLQNQIFYFSNKLSALKTKIMLKNYIFKENFLEQKFILLIIFERVTNDG